MNEVIAVSRFKILSRVTSPHNASQRKPMDPDSANSFLLHSNEFDKGGAVVLPAGSDIKEPNNGEPLLPASRLVPFEILASIAECVGRFAPQWTPDTRTLHSLYSKPDYFRISPRLKLLLPKGEDGHSNLSFLKEVKTMGFIEPSHLECLTNLRVLKFTSIVYPTSSFLSIP